MVQHAIGAENRVGIGEIDLGNGIVNVSGIDTAGVDMIDLEKEIEEDTEIATVAREVMKKTRIVIMTVTETIDMTVATGTTTGTMEIIPPIATTEAIDTIDRTGISGIARILT